MVVFSDVIKYIFHAKFHILLVLDALLEDTELQSVQEVRTIMEDHEDWSKRVKAIMGRPDDDLGKGKVRY